MSEENVVETPKMSTMALLKISIFWFASNFLWGALMTIMIPAEIDWLDHANHVERAGLITGLGAIVALIIPLVVGPMSDRCASRWGRRRPFIGIGIVLNVLGLALMALAFGQRSLVLYFVAFLIVQLGNNVAGAAYAGIIPDLVPEKQRGSASGFMAIMSQFGTLAGVLITALLIPFQVDDLRKQRVLNPLLAEGTADSAVQMRYLVIAIVLVVLGLLTLKWLKEKPLPCRPAKLDLASHIASLWIDPRQYPDFAWVWITRFLVMLGFYAFLPFISYYLQDVIKVENPSGTASMLIAVILVGASISGLLGGMISDKIGRKKVVYIANGIMGVMAFFLIFCRTLPAVMVVGILFGIGYGAYVSVDWALGTDVLPSQKDAGKDLAVWHIAMTLPQSISGPIAGFLIAGFGKEIIKVPGQEDITKYTVPGYTAMLIMCTVFVLLGAVLLRNVRSVR